MLKITNVQTCNWDAAIRGMRNPMESHAKSDTRMECPDEGTERWCGNPIIGPNDLSLMKRLVNAGTDHSKFMRMITVSFDITAPLYWWKEFDTYKIAVVRNSCSTMHKIEARELAFGDFAIDGLISLDMKYLQDIIRYINMLIGEYKVAIGDEKLSIHRRIVKLLPDSYLQKATISTNYQVLRSIRNSDRKTHKLLEWKIDFMKFIDSLPYAKELLIEDDAYKYEKAKMFIEKFEKEHGPLYKFLERAEVIKPENEEYKKIIESGDKIRLCDDFDGDFDTDAQSKAFQEALNGIKSYAEKKDECEGYTCFIKIKGEECGHCKDLLYSYNAAENYHYFDCEKKGTGVAIPDKDIVEDTLVIEPKAFNGEEF